MIPGYKGTVAAALWPRGLGSGFLEERFAPIVDLLVILAEVAGKVAEPVAAASRGLDGVVHVDAIADQVAQHAS